MPSPSGENQKTTKPWHSPSDTPRRKAMGDMIIHLLELKNPNAADWLAKLPNVAAKLEEILYFSADSLFEYVDVTTLKARLQQVAIQMGGKEPAPAQQQKVQDVGVRGNTDDHRKHVLKQQQQRLLLLRHACKCNNDIDCKVTPHCPSMKVLWKHIMNCKDQECKFSHCLSSRYLLSHYSKCKDDTCPVCGPVRDAIRKSLSKTDATPKASCAPASPEANSPLDEGVASGNQERKDIEKALRLHLMLLKHSAYCEDSTTCKETRNCPKMKVSQHLAAFSSPFSCYLIVMYILLSVRTSSCIFGTARRRTRAASPARR